MTGPKWLGRNPRKRAIILHQSVEGAKGRFEDGKGGCGTIDAMFAFLGVEDGIGANIPRLSLMRAT
jgi:hypothetical protein